MTGPRSQPRCIDVGREQPARGTQQPIAGGSVGFACVSAKALSANRTAGSWRVGTWGDDSHQPVSGGSQRQGHERGLSGVARTLVSQESGNQIADSIKEAEKACAGGTSQDCAAAWDTVEELSAAASHKKANVKVRAGPADPRRELSRGNASGLGTLRGVPRDGNRERTCEREPRGPARATGIRISLNVASLSHDAVRWVGFGRSSNSWAFALRLRHLFPAVLPSPG